MNFCNTMQMNSRMKDFYDIWFLSKNHQFHGEVLQKAIKQTFMRRRTEIPVQKPVVFTESFYEDVSKIIQWRVFKNKIGQEELPSELQRITEEVEKFLWMPTNSIRLEEKFTMTWYPDKGWF